MHLQTMARMTYFRIASGNGKQRGLHPGSTSLQGKISQEQAWTHSLRIGQTPWDRPQGGRAPLIVLFNVQWDCCEYIRYYQIASCSAVLEVSHSINVLIALEVAMGLALFHPGHTADSPDL